jgi:hypothetical protein
MLILLSHLNLGLSSGLLPSGFPAKLLYVFLISCVRTTYRLNLIKLDHSNGKLARCVILCSSSVCNFLHSREVVEYRFDYTSGYTDLRLFIMVYHGSSYAV